MNKFMPAKYIFSYIIIGALLIAIPSNAQAKVMAFITQNSNGDYYEYDYDLLLDSYVSSIFGEPSVLFDAYRSSNVIVLLDDVNGYIDYEAALDEYVEALLTGKKFNIDTYASSSKAKIVSVDIVNVVTVDDNGLLLITEKEIADPLVIAMAEVNSASDVSILRKVLEKRANVLGLNLSDYNQLYNFGKAMAVAGVLDNREDGFADAEELKVVFDEEVQLALSALVDALDTINSAGNFEDFEDLLLENGEVFGLELQSYGMIISSRKAQAIVQVFESAPFATVITLRDEFNSSVADILKSYVIVSYTDYDITLPAMVDKQMSLSAKPQWQIGGVWTNATRAKTEEYVDPFTFVQADLIASVTEIIATSNLKLRDMPTTEGVHLLTVPVGEVFAVEDYQEVLEGTVAGSEGYWFKITVGGITGWVCGNYTDWVAKEYNTAMFQFLSLSGSSGATVSDLGTILHNKGTLSGMEAVFYQASQEYNINEIFLTSLALHESGNGTSQLASGQLVYEGRNVYNMFGIGAYDSNPNHFGAKRAYEEGWFTPEAAIIGGAYFASKNYVNHATYLQNTLYKMRWNPATPGTHQYATDVGWARKQTSSIRKLYEQVNIYSLRFDIPRYKK